MANVCRVDNCNNLVICKNLCNAHYLRYKKGKDLNSPIQIKNREGCIIENCNGIHEGKGYCRKHLRKKNREDTWEFLIKSKGGSCNRCNGVFHLSVYDFHHLDPKEKEIGVSKLIGNVSMDDLLKEVDKCILLCSNCHRITHYENYNYIWK